MAARFPGLFSTSSALTPHTHTQSVEKAQDANKRMENHMGSKCRKFNTDKIVCMVISHKKAKKKLRSDLRRDPPTLSGKMMKVVEEKYLGRLPKVKPH